MSVEITFGGTCRDVSKLPQAQTDLKRFFDTKLVPAIWDDFSKNIAMTNGSVDLGRGIDLDVQNRGCEIGGSITIRL